MVGISSKQIMVQWGAITDGKQSSFLNKCTKSFEQGITIGRVEGNDLQIPMLYVSANHGKITYSSKYLGFSNTIYYEDNSKYGTKYLAPGITDFSKAIPLHKQKVEIQSGCKLLIFQPHKEGVAGVYFLVLF